MAETAAGPIVNLHGARGGALNLLADLAPGKIVQIAPGQNAQLALGESRREKCLAMFPEPGGVYPLSINRFAFVRHMRNLATFPPGLSTADGNRLT